MFQNSKSYNKHVRKWVIGSGFLSGVWIAIGIDPEQQLLSTMMMMMDNLNPAIKWFILLLPTILTFFTAIIIYARGGFIGLLAVFIAFLGGTMMMTKPVIGAVLAVSAVILGISSFR